MPNCFWICSSGKPFVSGTMVFTQTNCKTIMPANNEKTYPGGKAETIFGKKVVSRAAKIQCVKLPSVWPSARWRLGNISEMKTQMTARGPIACAAMKAKMQTRTMEKCSVNNAHATTSTDAM